MNLAPISLDLVTWNSTGQVVSLELQYLRGSNVSMRSLDALIYNSTWKFNIVFSNVNSSNPLTLGSEVTQSFFLAGAPLKVGVVYDITTTGTYVNGTNSISNFEVELQT